MLTSIDMYLPRLTGFMFLVVARWLIKAIFPHRTLRGASGPTRSRCL